MAAVYQDGSWLSVPDHRGETVYPISDNASVKTMAPGDYPADTTSQAPATTLDKWVTDRHAQQQSLSDAATSEKLARVNKANGITQGWQT